MSRPFYERVWVCLCKLLLLLTKLTYGDRKEMLIIHRISIKKIIVLVVEIFESFTTKQEGQIGCLIEACFWKSLCLFTLFSVFKLCHVAW
ncbi:hypothetical protein T07_12548 [Trichinella nelsoni]|uniref:Uncharacterized protein n=1 Tax=Trichinella nelsoni TaxID=6336 RepID=A0A0V0RZF8_9BILA|nr:hypothetical protein T07_12548 [Trichinella nelsoni]